MFDPQFSPIEVPLVLRHKTRIAERVGLAQLVACLAAVENAFLVRFTGTFVIGIEAVQFPKLGQAPDDSRFKIESPENIQCFSS